MRLQPIHYTDLEFTYASSFLKRTLKQYFKSKDLKALDIPCGTGRNIFLLTKYFDVVKGVDFESQYLAAINSASSVYGCPSIELEQSDVFNIPLNLNKYDFVCNIHLYNTYLTGHILNRLRPGALFLLETPNCRGGNYKELPTEAELKTMFSNEEILQLSFKRCNHKENTRGTGVAQALIRKR